MRDSVIVDGRLIYMNQCTLQRVGESRCFDEAYYPCRGCYAVLCELHLQWHKIVHIANAKEKGYHITSREAALLKQGV